MNSFSQIDVLTAVNNKVFFFSQISASLEEQEFTEAWGQKAKDTFSDSFINTLNPELQKILKKIKVLGPANLPTSEREKVSFHIPYY